MAGDFIKIIVFIHDDVIYQANIHYDEDGEEGMIPRFDLILKQILFAD